MDFSAQGNTAAGTLPAGLTDSSGNTWHIASGKLVATSFNAAKVYIATQKTMGQIDIYFTYGSSGPQFLGFLGLDPANFAGNYIGGGIQGATLSGLTNDGNLPYASVIFSGLTLGHQYVMRVFAQDTISGHQRAGAHLYDPTSGAIVAVCSNLDTTHGPNAIGRLGIGQYGGACDPIDRLVIWDDTSMPTFVAGTVTFVDADATTFNMSATPQTGGSGVVTRSWSAARYDSGTIPFPIPGVIAGATGLTLAYTPSDPAGVWWTQLYFNDPFAGGGGYSNQVPGTVWQAPADTAAFGDSILCTTPTMTDPTSYDRFLVCIRSLNGDRKVTGINRALSGQRARDYLPAAHPQYATGNQLYPAALAAALAANVKFVLLMLGTNDSFDPVAAATYGAYMGAITADLVSHGLKVLVSYSPLIQQNTVQNTVLQTYQPYLDALEDGANVFVSRGAWAHSRTHPGDYDPAVNLHPTGPTGTQALGLIWANDFSTKVLGLGPRAGGLFGNSLGGFQ